MAKSERKTIASNKKAFHDYFIEDKIEAGVVLVGTEVKSVRMGKVNLKDSYAYIRNGEAILSNMHISPYEKGNIFNVDPMRDRKLLLNKQEINRLQGTLSQKGFTLVPLNLYLSGKWVKLEIGIARGKQLYDKREAIAEKDAKRAMEQRLKESVRG
jgi:SsrA-binding protein